MAGDMARRYRYTRREGAMMTVTGQPAVRLERTIPASPGQVYRAWLVGRLRYHTISLGTTFIGGVRWWRRTRR